MLYWGRQPLQTTGLSDGLVVCPLLMQGWLALLQALQSLHALECQIKSSLPK